MPTCDLRWHKHVVSMSWSTQWDENFTLTLQQRWVSNTGAEEWRPLPEHKTIAKNMMHYG